MRPFGPMNENGRLNESGRAGSGADALAVGRLSLLRKLMHLAMTLVPAAGWLVSRQAALWLAAALLAASLALEGVRRGWPAVNRLLWRLLPTVFRAWEGQAVLGSTWLAIGMALTAFLWDSDISGTAILFLVWGDPAAEVAGRRWGRRGAGKTLVGSLGCLAACLMAGVVGVGLGGLSPWSVGAGALVATAVERWSPPPDDNLWMPVLSGLAMALIQLGRGGSVKWFPIAR